MNTRSGRRSGKIQPKVVVLIAVSVLAVVVFALQLRGVFIKPKAQPEPATEGALYAIMARVEIALNNGITPATFDDLPEVGGQKVTRVDGWERPLTLSISPAKAKDTLVVIVRSDGIDGVAGNEDDFVLTAEIVRLASGEHGALSHVLQRPPE